MIDLGLPSVSSAQMRRVDELAVDHYHLKLLQMMENAGRALAHLTRQELTNSRLPETQILVLAGPGGNGGGGIVAARRLHNWGARVRIQLATAASALAPVPAHQLEAARAAGVPIIESGDRGGLQADVILDALLGYSAQGAPRPPMDALVRAANRAGAPILALDLPTGLDPDSGQPHDPAIRATCTLTLALPKKGLLTAEAQPHVGHLWLADISIPARLYRDLELEVPPDLFAKSDLLRLI